jgi:FlaG/FlaF family flagellin (archaellin)
VSGVRRSVDNESADRCCCGQLGGQRSVQLFSLAYRPVSADRQSCATVVEMDEPSGSESTGMGPTPSGPSFVPWAPAPGETPPIKPPLPARSAKSMAKPTRRLPTVITVAVILVVAVIVTAASLVAHFADTQVRAPVARKQPIPQVTAQSDRIEFTTSEGSGQLVLLRHSWLTTGQVPPTSGSYLRVEVELTCTGGSVDYDPYNFQVFDQTGRLFETAIEGAGDSMLDTGTLRPGERVRGTIAFDMPHSEATLLMSDDANQTVTALKVPD